MKILMFYHSLVSDWNHGNAHFLRGVATELIKRGNEVEVWEPENSWSRMNLIADKGNDAIEDLQKYYPLLKPHFYKSIKEFDNILRDADAVIVHEWNEHQVVSYLGELKNKFGYYLYFHDTHHRAVTDKKNVSEYDLTYYDGVIAFGNIIRDMYLENNWSRNAWTIHEAADTSIFYPHKTGNKAGDIVWIGNWGDEERSEEIREYLIKPVKELNINCTIYGVRYPESAIAELNDAGIRYGGYLPNYKAPEIFANYNLTVHIPRSPYVKLLKGIPTIRPFEAMACGIPFISSYWEDSENLFTPGKDFLFAKDGAEMKNLISELLNNKALSKNISDIALNTISSRHTCSHRVDQLYDIFEQSGIKEKLLTRN